jgi:GWxTD domain-containing protein
MPNRIFKRESIVSYLIMILFIFLNLQNLLAQEELKLELRYKEWLNKDVAYIIAPEEKEFFLQLKTNEERDRFIEDFWQRRDPYPETPENEFKKEYYQRLEYANKNLGTESSRAGWMTDRGRIYILLGKPNYIFHEVSGIKFYPLEIWYYDNPSLRDLPTGLRIMFYKRRGVGEYRLYSPFFDGLGSLMPAYYGVPNDVFLSNPNFLAELDYDIRQAALSVAPGVSLTSSEDVLVKFYSPPREYIKVPFSGKTAIVTAKVSYATIPLEMAVHYVKYNDSAYVLNYAVEVPPKYLSFNQRDDKFYTRIDINGTIVDHNNQVAVVISDNAYIEQTKEQFDKSKTYRFVYKGQKLLIPGRYTLNLVLRDFISNQMGSISEQFAISSFGQEKLQMSTPVLCYKIERESAYSANKWKPFVYDNIHLFPKIDNTFDRSDTVYIYSQLYYPRIESLSSLPAFTCLYEIRDSEGKVVKKSEEKLIDANPGPFGRINLLSKLPINDLPPGHYKIRINAEESNLKQSIEVATDMTISGLDQNLGRLQFERMLEESPLFAHISLGQQYFNRGEIDQAQFHFRTALEFNRNSLDARVKLAKCLILKKDYKAAEELLIEALHQEPNNYDALICMGALQSSLQRYTQAIENYKKALDIGLETASLRNALGEAYMLVKDYTAAKESFERSLKLNPEQQNVKDVLQQLEKMISDS